MSAAYKGKERVDVGKLKAVVLAGGRGKRMQAGGEDIPKVMRKLLGRPLLGYVLDALPVSGPEDAIIVAGYLREQVISAFPGYTFAVQERQLGTGHAVMCARNALSGFTGDILVCCGDTPLVSRETYSALAEIHSSSGNDCTILSGTSPVPLEGYGRVIHSPDGGFIRIVEEKDCTEEEASVMEYNSGIYVFRSDILFPALDRLENDNAQGEYYLTDVPAILKGDGMKVGVCVREMGWELIGINTPEQLARAEAILLNRQNGA